MSRSFAALFVLPLMLAGCDNRDSTATDSANPGAQVAVPASPTAGAKACDVLTQADAATALGREVTNLNATGGAAALDICQFGYSGEKLMDSGQVSVTIMAVDLATMRAGVVRENGTIEEVPGLGSGAFYTPEFGLYVGRGNRTAIYLLGAGGMTDAKQRMIALAKATADRL